MSEDHHMGGATPPISPQLEANISTIDSYPDHTEDGPSTSTLPANTSNSDIPLSIPPSRSPSPPLPSLRHVPFPPDEAPDDGNESEDEVLYKLPVYMSTGLFPQVQLFQYPMNTRSIVAPEWALKRGKKVSARVKEQAGKVEVEIPIHGEVDAWRHERAKELSFEQDLGGRNGRDEVVGGVRDKKGQKTGGSGKKQDVKWGDKVRLSSEPVPGATGYYTGQVLEGALHLHPISKISQFRTSLAYLDDMDLKNRMARVRGGGDEEDDKRPKQQQPPRKGEEENDGSGSIKDFRDKMRSTQEALQRDEWVSYEWRQGSETIDQLQALYLNDESKQVRLECTTRGLDYLDKA